MRNRIVVLLVFYTFFAHGQQCNEYASLTQDNAGKSMHAFNEYIDVHDDNGQKRLTIYGFSLETSLVVVVEAISEYTCLGTDAQLVLEFADKSKVQMKNGLTNCDRQLVLHLLPGQSELGFLKNKQLKSITVLAGARIRAQANVDEARATRIRLSVACLLSLLKQKLMEDSLKNVAMRGEQVSSDTSRIYTVVEEQPQFFGGYEALVGFLFGNIKLHRKDLVPGTMYVSFVVARDGMIQDAYVLTGLSEKQDAEALRVVKLMPRWQPGLQNGKPVSVRFILPIKFSKGRKR